MLTLLFGKTGAFITDGCTKDGGNSISSGNYSEDGKLMDYNGSGGGGGA